MAVHCTYKPPVFKVEQAPGWAGQWTITEDGRFDCPVNFDGYQAAHSALVRCRQAADKVVAAGYFQERTNTRSVFVFIDQQRVDLVLPYGFTPRIRAAAIRALAMQHFIDQEKGDME